MSFETIIYCEECDHTDAFRNIQLEAAKKQFFADGGSEAKGGRYLCATCTWQHRTNFFAIDVDLEKNRSYQVLAVIKDKTCFADTRISFGRLDIGSGVMIRRITQPEYETLREFGIPAVEPHKESYRRPREGALFYNGPERQEPEKDQIEVNYYDKDSGYVIDLSNAVEELLADTLPKAETPEEIVKNI